MQKKGIVRATILAVIFFLAVVIFSYFTNRGNKDLSAEMESATLPTISFTTEGQEVNTLMGYVSDMELTSMRDTITPVKDNTLTMNIRGEEAEIEKISWQVYTIDGKECLQKETIDQWKETINLQFHMNGMLNREKILKVTLHLPAKDVFYYTRLVDSADCNYGKCLDFAEYFHTNTIQNQDRDNLARYLNKKNPDKSGGFQKVTLHSGLERLTWGKLAPEVISAVNWEIKECNETYTSLMLSYQVKAKEAFYDVEEFYRIRIYGEGKIYLMDYVREMEQTFEGSADALTSSGINLGIVSNVEYKDTPDGNRVAFIQNDELWHYDREQDEFSLVFSFADSEKADMRNEYNHHEIHISALEQNGNMLFYVVGHMNRGIYEGKTGVAIYYFDSEKNSVEEKAFVPSRKGYEIMRGELGQFVHYSMTKDILYVMAEGCLYQIDLKEDIKEVLVRGLVEGQYMVSEDGKLLVYQNTFGGSEKAEQIKMLNLETGEGFSVDAAEGDYVKPIGFIHDDLVYGYLHAEDEGIMNTGEKLLPMFEFEIVDLDQKLVKEYKSEGAWIKSVSIDENVLSIERVIKSDDMYQDTAADYITSNEEIEEKSIQLTTTNDDLRGRIACLKFSDGISDLDTKVLKPKQILQEHRTEVQLDEAKMQGKYYVYALGHLQKVFDVASEAVAYANQVQGVAVSSAQRYLFVRGNWPNAYEIPGLDAFTVQENETPMAACLRKIMVKEGKEVDIAEALAEGQTPKEILDQYSGGEGLSLQGCTMEELQYLIAKDKAVIAMLGEDHPVLLTGYNKTNIAYMDPIEGKRIIVTKDKMESMLAEYGNILIGYTK